MTALRIAIPIALVAFVSWADHATGSIVFVLLAPFTAAFIFLAFFPLWPTPAYWPRAALVTLASLWLAVLPWVPWNHVKRFYRDCGRIERAGRSVRPGKPWRHTCSPTLHGESQTRSMTWTGPTSRSGRIAVEALIGVLSSTRARKCGKSLPTPTSCRPGCLT